MKIYISGKISGLPMQETKEKFQAAKDMLEYLGFEVVNPLENGLDFNDDWKKHIVRDIENILTCDSMYMFDNWIDSVGASIEYYIALRTKMDVWFESNIVRNQNIVLRIQNAIHEVTGMNFSEYTTKSRKRDTFFARMIFAYHCSKNKINYKNIANYVNRDSTSILHLLNKYDDEVKYNKQFRVFAQRVNNILNKTVNDKA